MNIDEIKELIKIFDESTLSRLEVTKDKNSLLLEKATLAPTAPAITPTTTTVTSPTPTPVAAESSPAAPAAGDQILSPMVGTFYRCPSPNAAPYVKVGDTIRKGQTIGIIEAMKIMNELEAEFDCKITDILIEDGQPIEYGAPLFNVEKL